MVFLCCTIFLCGVRFKYWLRLNINWVKYMDVLIISRNKLFREAIKDYIKYFYHSWNVDVVETMPSKYIYPLTIGDVYPPPENLEYYVLVVYPRNITTRNELFKYGYFALFRYDKVIAHGKIDDLIDAIREEILS